MKFPMTLIEHYDNYECRRDSQTLEWDYDNFKGSFHVHDLCGEPEDALIERSLFNADDFIAVLEWGMDLGRKGYTGVDLKNI